MAKKEKTLLQKIGPWAFILGLVIAIVSALTGQLFWGLGLLGLVVGLLNITEKESSMYLLASLTFLLSANSLSVTLTKVVSFIPFVGEWLKIIDPLLANITLFVAPGAAVVALKALYSLSKD
ncbi:MAG: hypothetical protein QXE31_04700 [Candidatus Woesearchaeota archaeon]